jgi:hypothetical protein
MVKQMVKDIPALHGMEHLRSLFINLIIQNFQQVAALIEAKNDTFVPFVLQRPFIFGPGEGVAVLSALTPCLNAEGM